MSGEKPHIRVAKWDDFQHYTDRDPPWIKLYNRLLDDYEYGCLPDASKAHLTGLWMLASRTGNRIPLDVDWIAQKVHATDPLDLRPLLSAGFIELYHHASEPLAQNDSRPLAFARSREAEGETEAETESSEGSSLRSSPSGASPDVENSSEDGEPNPWGATVDACRESLWLDDDPPRGRSVGEELSVAKQLLERWKVPRTELLEAIDGFARLRDRGFWGGWIEKGDPACLTAMNRVPDDEEGIPVFIRCLHEARKGDPGRRKPDEPAHVSEVEIGA